MRLVIDGKMCYDLSKSHLREVFFMNYCGYHTHTTFSDGKNSMEEMVLAAIERGMPAIGFSDHSDSPYQDYCMRQSEYPMYLAELERMQEKYGDRITILKGIELDSNSDPAITEKLDYFLCSVHELVFDGRFYGIDHAASLQMDCINNELGGDKLAFAKCYFDELTAHVLKNKPTIIGHFDVLTKFSLMDEEDPAYQRIALDAMEQMRSAANVLEVNTGAISRKWRDRPYPADFLLRRWRELGGQVVLGADTHAVSTIDCAFPLAVEIIKKAGFDHLLTLWPDGFHEEKIG